MWPWFVRTHLLQNWDTKWVLTTTLNEISVRLRFQFILPDPCSDSSDIQERWTKKNPMEFEWSCSCHRQRTTSSISATCWIHLVPGWVDSSPTRHRETMAVLRMPWFWLVSELYTNRMMCRRYTISHGSSNKQTKAKTTQGEMVVLATDGTWMHRQI